MQNIKCAICGDYSSYCVLYEKNYSEKDFRPKKFVSRRPPDKIHFRIVKCNQCGLVFSNPIANRDKILSSYKKSDFYPEEDIENLTDVYEYYVKNKIPQKVRGKILEIGCGNGRLLSRLVNIGFDKIVGVEPSRKAVMATPKNVNRKNIIIDFFKNRQFKSNHFDAIIFMQVLDHVMDPNIFLKEVNRILKPGGYVLALVHNSRSWSARLLGERSPIIDLQHIYLFDKVNIKKIFQKNGFRVKGVFDTFTRYSILYWMKLLPIPKALKKYLSGTKMRFLSKINVKIYAGNMGIVATKQK
jgi:SAM-dependent methyltransferase